MDGILVEVEDMFYEILYLMAYNSATSYQESTMNMVLRQ